MARREFSHFIMLKHKIKTMKISRLIIISFILLLNLAANAQTYKLQGTWISNNNDIIKFDTLLLKSTYYPSNDKGYARYSIRPKYELKNDSLYIKDSGMGEMIFQITSSNDTVLILKPISDDAKYYSNSSNKIVFYNKKYKKKSRIKISKIIFHQSACFGSCNIIHLSLNANKTFYLDGTFTSSSNFYSDIDSVRTGVFDGILVDSIFQKIENEIRLLKLSKIKADNEYRTDASKSAIVFYTNRGKYIFKYRKSPSCFNEIIQIFNNIHKQSTVVRRKDIIKLKYDSER